MCFRVFPCLVRCCARKSKARGIDRLPPGRAIHDGAVGEGLDARECRTGPRSADRTVSSRVSVRPTASKVRCRSLVGEGIVRRSMLARMGVRTRMPCQIWIENESGGVVGDKSQSESPRQGLEKICTGDGVSGMARTTTHNLATRCFVRTIVRPTAIEMKTSHSSQPRGCDVDQSLRQQGRGDRSLSPDHSPPTLPPPDPSPASPGTGPPRP